MNAQKLDRNGVTLVEAVMVIGLLAAAAVAGMFTVNGSWLNRQTNAVMANDIADTLAAAHETAIRHRTPVSVRREISRTNQRLLITEEAGPLGPRKDWQVDLGPATRLSGSPAEIRFQPTGSADRPLEWTVTDGDIRSAIIVEPITGNVIRKLAM